MLGDLYSTIVITIFLVLLYRFIVKSNNSLVFREFVLIIYAINYLISPLITYVVDDSAVVYPMKISYESYFQLILPGFLFFIIGIYTFKTNVFKVDLNQLGKNLVVNEVYFKRLTIVGFLLNLFIGLFPGDLLYIVMLISLFRFVGAFSLLIVSRRYWLWPSFVMAYEFVNAFIIGMYHDALLWLIFFSIFYAYLMKPMFSLKLLFLGSLLLFVFFVQGLKGVYRANVWSSEKEASLSTAFSTGQDVINSDLVLSEDNFLSTLNRTNQAWILASTIDNMDRTGDFQGLNNVQLYLEAALLPRFLSPNKLKSGDKGIFNKFSGHVLAGGTSMGLGIFADGYISYGSWGIAIFGYALGLLFSLVFKVVEKWSMISPIYVLMLFPLLNYAVRPDCELQTTITHIVKGLVLYAIVVNFTKYRFSLDLFTTRGKNAI